MKLNRRLLSVSSGLGVCVLAAAAHAGGGGPWSDNWDSYTTGQNMHGVGGWQGWDNDTNATAFTSTTQDLSAPNSIEIVGSSDLVQTWTSVTSGQWTLRTMVYVPAALTETSYFIVLNMFTHGDTINRNWSSQVHFNGATNMVSDDDAEVTETPVPLIRDQWVELRYEINLDNDTFEAFYNGQSVATGPWAQGGELSIDAIDLWGNLTTSPVYYDNLTLTPQAQVAALTDVTVLFGTYISGGLSDLLTSNDTYYRVRSSFGFTSAEPNFSSTLIGADSPLLTPTTITLTVEGRLSQAGGTMKLRMRNWSNNLLQQVHSYPIGNTDGTEVVQVSGTNRVRAADGRVELELRPVVMVLFSSGGFHLFADLVRIEVQ